MAQLLITLWFAMTALLGPGLCCCTLLPTATQVAEDHAAPPQTTIPKKCCHCEAQAPKEPLVNQSADGSRVPVQPSCPCTHKSPSSASLPKSNSEANPVYHGFCWWALLLNPAATSQLFLMSLLKTIEVCPLATAPDIYVLSQLRC